MMNPNNPHNHPPKKPSHPLYDDAREDIARQEGDAEAPPKRKPVIMVQQTEQPRLTYALIAANVLVFFIANIMGSSGGATTLSIDFVRNWSAWSPAILEDLALHRLFTAMFLHGDLMHLGFNMYALYVIGSSVERAFGHVRFGIIYFLGGLMGSLLSVLFGAYDVPSVGASGAIFAVWAADAVHVYRHRHLYGSIARSIFINMGLVLVVNVMLGLSDSRIDNWGHAGGFLGGAILAYTLGPKYVLRPILRSDGQRAIRVDDTNPLDENMLIIGAYSAACIVLLAIGVLFIAP